MGKKILIIDDDPVDNKLVQAGLEKNNYEVVVAGDGDEGLAKVFEVKPDLIILDVEMPRMNGYTFINELRKKEKKDHIPIIVLTSHEDLQPIFNLKGVKDYMLKPVRFDVLYDKVKNYFEGQE